METDKDIHSTEYTQGYKMGMLHVLEQLFAMRINLSDEEITKDMLREFNDKMVGEIK